MWLLFPLTPAEKSEAGTQKAFTVHGSMQAEIAMIQPKL